MVNAAIAARPGRVKMPSKSEASNDDSDIGGGVSLIDTSPNIAMISTHEKASEPAQYFVSKEAEVNDAPVPEDGGKHVKDQELATKLNPTSVPFQPAPATTYAQVNGEAHLNEQITAPNATQGSQIPNQTNYGAVQANRFVLPASVVDMLPPEEQISGQNYHLGQTYPQAGAYPNGTINGFANGMNQNGMLPVPNNFVQVPPPQQMTLGQGHGYTLNGAAPTAGSYPIQSMQQMPVNPQQQFQGVQNGQPQSLYAHIQAQKHALQQLNANPVYQHAAPGLVPSLSAYPQAHTQNSVTTQYNGNGQYNGVNAPLGLLPPSASHNNVLSPPATTAEAQEPYASEPRNFAPRQTEPLMSGPPPQFALPATPLPAQYLPQAQAYAQQSMPYQGQAQDAHADPFTVAPLPAGIQPLQSTPAQPSNAVAVYTNPVPDHIKAMRSAPLNNLTAGPTGRPSLEVALDSKNFPFIESPRLATAANHGVVKLKNRAEILAFLGRNSKVLNDNQEPVHIIMERVTSKTNDAYVEFMSMQAAISAVEKHQKTISGGRLSRLGDRPIDVELSSQAALMEDLFPLAHGIKWHGANPEILPDHPTQPWHRFKGFISDEEMTMLVKHVEVPQRRPFECMISTIKKLPWFMTNYITLRQRHSVFKAALDLTRLLLQAIKDKKHEEHFSQQLLRRLYTAAMLCPGFSVSQKDDIAFMVNLSEQQEREFNQPRFANCWTHIYTMAPKPGLPLDVLEWYIAIVREETARAINNYPLNVRAQLQHFSHNTDDYWGYFWHELDLPTGKPFDMMTLADLSTREFQTIDRILRRAFGQ